MQDMPGILSRSCAILALKVSHFSSLSGPRTHDVRAGRIAAAQSSPDCDGRGGGDSDRFNSRNLTPFSRGLTQPQDNLIDYRGFTDDESFGAAAQVFHLGEAVHLRA